jgi:hypothetical protein
MSVANLARHYPSIFATPVIDAVDRRIFLLRYFRNCLQCGFCKDHCCQHGVDIDLDNVERLLGLSGFEAFVGLPKESWFSEDRIADPEFPSGVHLRTRIRDGYCVFHDENGRGCKVHAWCVENGLDHHRYKPIVSLLFPVTFERGVLVPATEILDGTLVCSGAGATLYEGAREELASLFGPELVEELDLLSLEETECTQGRVS